MSDDKKTGWLGRLLGKGKESESVSPPIAEAPVTEAQPVAEAASLAEPVALDVAPVELVQAEPVAPKAPEQPKAPDIEKKSWIARLKDGLGKSSSKLSTGLADLFTKRKLDDESLEELEELLIGADLGVTMAAKVTARLAKTRFGQDVGSEEIRQTLAEEIIKTLAPVALPLDIDRSQKPFVILVVGVNGSGKTTTIGKMAKTYRDQGLAVTLAAGDTFRAAAVEQLKVWGERTGCPVISRGEGSDAASLAFEAVTESRARGDDILFIDTAGRLQNKQGLMEELKKVVRVIRKVDESAPHAVLLVLDATVGQNALSQVEIFGNMADVTGLILTKLDGTAKGGVLVALAEKFKLPVHAIGVGETAEDLRPFEAEAFAQSLVGLESLKS